MLGPFNKRKPLLYCEPGTYRVVSQCQVNNPFLWSSGSMKAVKAAVKRHKAGKCECGHVYYI